MGTTEPPLQIGVATGDYDRDRSLIFGHIASEVSPDVSGGVRRWRLSKPEREPAALPVMRMLILCGRGELGKKVVQGSPESLTQRPVTGPRRLQPRSFRRV